MRAKIKIPRQVARSMRVEPQAVVLVFSAIHPVPPLSLSPERLRATAALDVMDGAATDTAAAAH